MPVSGVPRNPLGETPDRLRRRRTLAVPRAGQTPALMTTDLRRDTLAPGTVRRVWRQAINLVLPRQPLSWSYNDGLGVVTRALRYKASSAYRGSGSSHTQYARPRPIRPAVHRELPPTRSAGNRRNLPVNRNRLTSFGRRVVPVNSPLRQRPRK